MRFGAKRFSLGFSACILFMVIMNSGCAPDQHVDYVLQVTDASTGKPLPGVVVSIDGNGHYHNNRLFPSHEKFDLLTNDRGEVTINAVTTEGWEYYVDFEKPGFHATII